MRKAAAITILFIAVFAVVYALKFPYSEYLEKAVSDLGSNKDLKITWAGSENRLLSVVLKKVTVATNQGVVAEFNEVHVRSGITGVIHLDGKGDDNFTLKASMKKGDVKFEIDNYPLPSFIASMAGSGTFHFEGNYDTAGKKGDVTFNGTLDRIPNPIVKFPAAIVGEAEIRGNDTKITFEAGGRNIKGNGEINIKGKAIDGSVLIDTGIIPLKAKVSGDLGNIKIRL